MNSADISSSLQTPSPAALDALQSRFALRVAARLSERAQDLGPDISERLRFAREHALQRARSVRSAAAAEATLGVTASGAAILGGNSGPRWWFKLAAAVPGLALVAGLMLIQHWQNNAQISVAAEIDAALLADDLPPDAYSDAGFVEFLKTPPRE